MFFFLFLLVSYNSRQNFEYNSCCIFNYYDVDQNIYVEYRSDENTNPFDMDIFKQKGYNRNEYSIKCKKYKTYSDIPEYNLDECENANTEYFSISL